MLDLRLLISASLATQPTRSSSTFHSPASTPPGRSTRAISGSARSMSNQCMAWPARTASRLASGSGIPSALPGTERTAGIARRNSLTRASLFGRLPGVVGSPGGVDLVQVAVRPADQLADGGEQGAPHRGERVIDPRRDDRVNGPRHDAVPLQPAQGDGEHPGGDAV